MSIYPNPVTDLLTIVPAKNKKEFTMELMNLSGRILLPNQFSGKTSLDISGLPGGDISLKLLLIKACR
jgi:hypothetical protein